MGVVEAALLRTAGSVVSPAVRRWLGRRRDKRERETPLIELIGTGIADDLGVRRAGRRLDDITDTVYERLQKRVRRREYALPDNEIAAALDAVTDTLQASNLSDDATFADDLDPALMATRLRRQLPDVPDRAGLSEAAVHLYGQVLGECCTCLTQLVVQLGPFQARATIHTLERLTAVADSLAEVLARLPETSLDAPAGTNHDTQFRSRYLVHLLTALDQLELFGIDVHRYRLRTPLSIAYISLTVTGDNTRGIRRAGSRWDPGQFRADSDADSASVRAEQALGGATRVLLRGDAGSGKTTLMQWIAVTAARHGFTGELDNWNGRTPFLIRLRDHVTQPLPAPERFLDLIAATIAGLMPAGWVHRQLDAGAILCIDGVDEVPEVQRRTVREWLRGLLAAYPDLRVVVTSRPAAASARWLNDEGFTSVFLERMGPTDLKALIRHWHEAVRSAGELPCQPHQLPGYEQRLLAQLDGSAHLQNLAGSPLLCAMLCALNLDRDSNLPRNRMDIYQAAIDMLLHRRDSQRGITTDLPDLTSRDQSQLLQEVAWWMTQNSRTELTRAEAEQRFANRLAGIRHVTAPAAAVLAHMIQRSGILREPIPDRIDFVHRTFQEYLAALEAADQGHIGALIEHAHLDTWRETIILAAGHAHAPVRTKLLTGLLALADEQPKKARRLRLLAAACLDTAPLVQPEVLAQISRHLRDLLPRSITEARSLAAVGEPLLDELPADLSGHSEAQAAAIVRAAALVNGPVALKTLARYGSDPRASVQRQLILAWDYFDPFDYANDVLAEAPLDNGSVTVTNAALIPALPRLRRLTETTIDTTQDLDLAQLDDAPKLTNLRLYSEGVSGDLTRLARHRELRDLLMVSTRQRHLDLATLLSALPNLESLSLYDLPPDQDIAAVADLPNLKQLRLDGAHLTKDYLNRITTLKFLAFTPGTAWHPDILEPLQSLESLWLSRAAKPLGGIKRLTEHLGRLGKLRSLWLARCTWLTDLTKLASIDTLTYLSIDDTPVADLSPLTRLSNLKWIVIGNEKNAFDLAPLAGLTALDCLFISDSAPGLDLTPFAGSRVKLHVSRRVDLGNVAGVRVKRYGSRDR